MMTINLIADYTFVSDMCYNREKCTPTNLRLICMERIRWKIALTFRSATYFTYSVLIIPNWILNKTADVIETIISSPNGLYQH